MGPRTAVLMCHAPIVIPAIGEAQAARCEATTRHMREAAGVLARSGARRIVVLSPHTPRHRGSFGFLGADPLRGDFGRFSHPGLGARFAADPAGLEALLHEADLEPVHETTLDHGALVPLWFLQEAGYGGPVLVLAFPWEAPAGTHAAFGQALVRAMDSLNAPWGLLASGDMSHALQPGAPGGFHPRARDFDAAVRACLEQGDPAVAAHIPAELRRIAAEDVVESLEVAAGALGPGPLPIRVLGYEAPFGVGYLEAVLREDGAT